MVSWLQRLGVKPVQIPTKCGNAVLLSQDDRRAIEETLQLVSTQACADRILEGLATDVCEPRAANRSAPQSVSSLQLWI